MNFPTIEGCYQAKERLCNVSTNTPFQFLDRISNNFNAEIYTKREDLQLVRSFKIRGAINKIVALSKDDLNRGIVCASGGNHAQGFAFACNYLKINGTVFMPLPTPKQKIDRVKMFGAEYIKIILQGDTYDDSQKEAEKYQVKSNSVFIHPFDDVEVIHGQATIALEILEQIDFDLDYMFIPVGGGGLVSGFLTVFKKLSPKTKIVGVEPSGATSFITSLRNNRNTQLKMIDKFAEGVAIQKMGDICFNYCKDLIDKTISVDEGRICKEILDLYNKEGIVVEPAGAISLACLDQFSDEIKGKKIGTIICGGNNDITRTPEIKERALLYSNLKHYFIVRFPQRAGSLKQFASEILGPTDDITFFEYSKKSNRVVAPAVVGIELKSKNDLTPLIKRMKEGGFYGEYLNEKPDLFQYLI